jgi:uncharacterized protein
MDRKENMAFAPRHVARLIQTALADTRVVAIVGPRQSGKTTLARQLGGTDRPYLTLDDADVRAAATSDPAGFIRPLGRAIIDEIQRAPELLLAIKRSVDEDPRPGRFLITGSADLFAGMLAPDSLAGRVETIELLPLSQAEIARTAPSRFLEHALEGEVAAGARAAFAPLEDRVLAGGFPEALQRHAVERRQAWLRGYARSLAARDVLDIAAVAKPEIMTTLIEHAALLNGQLLNLTGLGQRVGVDAKTIERWLTLLEQLFLVARVRPWHRNGLNRLVKTPKLHMLDSGLLAALIDVDAAALTTDRGAFGALLECFVHAEVRKAGALIPGGITINHYRDKDQVEVDFVVSRGPSRVIGIEVKASATAKADDFRGLKRLRDAAGPAFKAGFVLHGGEQIVPFGDRLWAAPVACLWHDPARPPKNPG